MLDAVGREKLPLNEVAEVVGNPVLVLRNDRSMRQWDAERMTKQRADGEPVCQRADHCRFGERADERPGGACVPVSNGRGIEGRHEHEQTRGNPACLDQLHALEFVNGFRIACVC